MLTVPPRPLFALSRVTYTEKRFFGRNVFAVEVTGGNRLICKPGVSLDGEIAIVRLDGRVSAVEWRGGLLRAFPGLQIIGHVVHVARRAAR